MANIAVAAYGLLSQLCSMYVLVLLHPVEAARIRNMLLSRTSHIRRMGERPSRNGGSKGDQGSARF